MGVGFVLLGLLVSMACTTPGAEKERYCTPGAYVYCRCQDRQPGTKLCKPDGVTFDACLPCDGSGNAGIGSGGSDAFGGRQRTETETSELNNGEQTDGEDKDAGEETKDSGATSVVDSGIVTPPPPKTDTTTTTQPASSEWHAQKVKNVAPRIETQKVADVPGTPKGGTVKDGVYVQAWVIEFTGADGEFGPTKSYSRETIEIKGDKARYAIVDDDGEERTGGMKLSLNEETKMVSVEYEFPAAKPRELGYDVTTGSDENDLTLIVYDPPKARVFVRQRESN